MQYESSRGKQIQFAFDRYADKGGEAIFTILVSKRNFSTWSHLLDELSRKCHAAVHKVFTCGEHSLVADAGELTEGELYICTAGRRPKLDPGTERTQQTAALVRASARFARRLDLGSVGIAQALAKRKMASKVQTRTITVFGNGLSDDVGHKVVLNKRTAPSFDKVLTLVSKLIPLRGGVRKLYTLPDCKLVRNLEQLQASKAAEFVAVGLKSLNKLLLPKHGDGSSGGSSEPPKPKQARYDFLDLTYHVLAAPDRLLPACSAEALARLAWPCFIRSSILADRGCSMLFPVPLGGQARKARTVTGSRRSTAVVATARASRKASRSGSCRARINRARGT